MEPKNEEVICDVVMRQLERRIGESLIVKERPDRVERRREAVELVCESTSGRSFALEHTRIESFEGQIAGGRAFLKLLEPLEADLKGQLPGRFALIVDIAATDGIRTSAHADIRLRLTEWIVAQASGLDGELETGGEGTYRVSETPPGVPFRATLARRRTTGNELLISRYAPDDLDALRVTRVARALERKTGKLALEKEKGRESVLILESNDISLANRAAIGHALAAALVNEQHPPDYVYLVETDGRPWYVYILKEGADIYPHPRLKSAMPVEIP
jgi:hypothetical protein